MPRGKYADIRKLERREALRKVVVQKLMRLRKLHGDEALGQALVASVSTAYTSNARQWVQLGQGDLYTVLRGLGVNIKIAGREVNVHDGRGSFSFTDDYYWSGLNFLLADVGKELGRPFVAATVSKYPASLAAVIKQAGMWDAASPEGSALQYLTMLHKTGQYDTTGLRLRMQGGEFRELRPLHFNPIKPIAFQPPTQHTIRNRQRHTTKPSAYGVLAQTLINTGSQETPAAWAHKALMAVRNGLTNRSREELNRHTDSRQAAALKRRIKGLPPELSPAQVLEAFYVISTRDLGLTPLQTTSLFTRLHQYLKVSLSGW